MRIFAREFMELTWKFYGDRQQGIIMEFTWTFRGKNNSYPAYTLHLRNLPSVGKDEVNNHPKLLFCIMSVHYIQIHTQCR